VPRGPLLYRTETTSPSCSKIPTATPPAATTTITDKFARPFDAFADESICLQCASPLATNCGFNNCALTRDTNTGWNLELAPCECEQCEQYCDNMLNVDGDARRRLLDRHDFVRLDKMLGVDEPLELVRARVVNRVPVLQLRLLFASMPTPSPEEQQLRDNVFCSFVQTAAFVTTEAGKRALVDRVFMRRAELEAAYQLSIPDAVLARPLEHIYFCALLLRVATAMRLSRPLLLNPVNDYTCSSEVQHLVLMLQLFADTHLDLVVYCDAMGGIYTDEYLETPMIETIFGSRTSATETLSECVHQTPLQRCWPHPLRCTYVGEMVDLSCSLPQANIWSNVRNGWATKTSSLLHVLLVKSVNKKCKYASLRALIFTDLVCRQFRYQP
jgi:hypothetical protein